MRDGPLPASGRPDLNRRPLDPQLSAIRFGRAAFEVNRSGSVSYYLSRWLRLLYFPAVLACVLGRLRPLACKS